MSEVLCVGSHVFSNTPGWRSSIRMRSIQREGISVSKELRDVKIKAFGKEEGVGGWSIW